MNQINTPTPDVSPETVPAAQTPASTYVAPAIESVFTADDMAREVLYAGTPNSNPGPVAP